MLNIINHKSQTFVTGLFWQTLSDPKTVKADIKSLSEKLSQDFYLTRNAGVNQAGFAAAVDGAEKGQISLASVVAEYIQKKDTVRSWMVAINLGEGIYAYVVSRDDALLPEGDVSGARDVIVNKMQQDYSFGSWGKVFAPADFGFPGAQEITIDEILPLKRGKINVGNQHKLKPITEGSNKNVIIIAAVTLAVLGGGAKFYMDFKDTKAAEDLQRLALEKARENLRLGNTSIAPVVKVEPPWINQPPAHLFAEYCSAINSSMLKPGGWLLIEYSCNGTSKNYKWERSNTPISYLLSELPEAAIELTGAHASMLEPISIAYEKYDEPLSHPKYAALDLLSKAQTLAIDLKIYEVAPVITPNPDPNAPPPPPPEWRTYNFSFTSNVNPTAYVNALSRDGLRITDVKYRPFGGGAPWTVSGAYYVGVQ